MPAVGKESEQPYIPEVTPQPVEQTSYVEKVEKQVETKQPATNQTPQPQVKTDTSTSDMGRIVSAQFAVQTKPKITLPMSENELADGLHHKVWESVRWLSEWCVMMIKKYPGRVFYLPPETK